MANYTNPAGNTNFYAEAWGDGGNSAGVGAPFSQAGGGGGAYANVHITGLSGGETFSYGDASGSWKLTRGSDVLVAAPAVNNVGGLVASSVGDHKRAGGSGDAGHNNPGPGGGGGTGARRNGTGVTAVGQSGAADAYGRGGNGGAAGQVGENAPNGPGNGGGGYGSGLTTGGGLPTGGGIMIWLPATWDPAANGGQGGPIAGAAPDLVSGVTEPAPPNPGRRGGIM
jgi:hypothetical protein